ncbi:MAG TPA: competence/damage-inducible protein A [Dehalococcoidia bacterium]|jgi:nicotinamide-nucleotide amidase|nr:competence/damage-inducible protein A [Dehalococcoidia bacterium]
MKAEILSIGTEILLGEIVDTNATYIASRLPGLGIDLYFKAVVGDNMERLTETIGRARERSDLVICTGGLGPTEDDLTREAICAVLGEEPHVDRELEATLRSFFERRGYSMPESNVKQCWLIPSARAIPNPRGTAPGWWAERDGKIIVAMPGPPTEMTRMWEDEVAPELRARNPGGILVTRTLKTAGVGEGTVDEMMSPLLKSQNPSIGIYARADGVHVRLGAKAPDEESAWKLIVPVEEEARRILGAAIWGADEDTFESVIGDMAKERGVTLATMESCTGGLLASTLTDVAGSSAFFRSGIVSYQTEVKIESGVPAEVVEEFGVISPECARAMAKAARERFEASVGVGITGVAGPEEQEGKPVGTVHIGIDAIWAAPQTMSYVFPQGRTAVKRRAVTTALVLLRQALLDYRAEALV